MFSRLQSVEHREPSVHCERNAHRQQNNMHGLLADCAGKVGWHRQLLFDMCVVPACLCCAGGQNESFMRLQAICSQDIDEMRQDLATLKGQGTSASDAARRHPGNAVLLAWAAWRGSSIRRETYMTLTHVKHR
jgi:hypothetical protein